MSTSPLRHERRAAQRFDYQLPVSIRVAGTENEAHGLIYNLSARGAFFYTETSITEGSTLDLTLLMPSEITLTESMHVRCKGRVLRVGCQDGGARIGVAVQLEGYEFLSTCAKEAVKDSFSRISSLHDHVPNSEPISAFRTRQIR